MKCEDITNTADHGFVEPYKALDFEQKGPGCDTWLSDGQTCLPASLLSVPGFILLLIRDTYS